MAYQLSDLLETLCQHLDRPGPGARARSLYHWVLLNGLPFDSTPLDRREWALVQNHIQYTMPQQCFANCQRTVLDPLFLHIDQIARGELGVLPPFDYVEGYVLNHRAPIPIHHAWLLLNGKVIDPTLRLRTSLRRRVLPDRAMGLFPKTYEYYGAVIRWRDVASCIKRNKAWHTVLDDPRGGWPLLHGDR